MSCPHHDNDVADGSRQQDKTEYMPERRSLLRRLPRKWCPYCRQESAQSASQTSSLFSLFSLFSSLSSTKTDIGERQIASGLRQMQGETLPAMRLDRILDALGLPALLELTEAERTRLRTQMRRLLFLIGFILFVTTLAQPELIGQKAIETLWFGKTGSDVLKTAGLWLLLGLGWAAKPLFALLAPRTLSERACRRTLTGSALAAAVLWLALDHVHAAGAIAVLVIGIGGLLALASTVMGGLLVEQGQRMGATGRLGALHAAAIFLARLTGAGAAGLLGTATLHWTAPFCAALLIGFALLCSALLQTRKAHVKLPRFHAPSPEAQEKAGGWCAHVPSPASSESSGERGNAGEQEQALHGAEVGCKNRTTGLEGVTAGQPRRAAWSVLQTLLRSRTMWGAACIAFLIYIAPNFAALQHQENMRLGFSAGAQDCLDFVGGVCGLLGVGGYLWLCRRLPLQTLLVVGILCNALGTLLYLGYQSLPTALLIEGANGLLSALVFAMLFDLAIRAIPRGSAMLGYALLTGIITLASHLSNVVGSWLTIQAGWGFMQVVSLSAGLSLPALAVVALLPATLLDRREGKLLPAEPETAFPVGAAHRAAFGRNA